jgi:hypothetical protein
VAQHDPGKGGPVFGQDHAQSAGLADGKGLFGGDLLGKVHPFIHGSHEGESNLAAGLCAGVTVKG